MAWRLWLSRQERTAEERKKNAGGNTFEKSFVTMTPARPMSCIWGKLAVGERNGSITLAAAVSWKGGTRHRGKQRAYRRHTLKGSKVYVRSLFFDLCHDNADPSDRKLYECYVWLIRSETKFSEHFRKKSHVRLASRIIIFYVYTNVTRIIISYQFSVYLVVFFAYFNSGFRHATVVDIRTLRNSTWIYRYYLQVCWLNCCFQNNRLMILISHSGATWISGGKSYEKKVAGLTSVIL